MVKFIEKYLTINNVLSFIALFSILPINAVIAGIFSSYFFITDISLSKRSRLLLKLLVIGGYTVGLLLWGQNMLLLTKVMHFSLFIAMVTNLILFSISKEDNLIVFVNIFFIGFLSKFNPIFLLSLFLILFFKQKLERTLLVVMGVVTVIVIALAVHLKEKNEWSMADLIDGLLVMYYENTDRMDVSYKGYYQNPDGYILVQSDELLLQPYLSVNRFTTFDKENNEWISSPIVENTHDVGKLFYSFVCKCAVDKKNDWKFSSKVGFGGKKIQGSEGVYYAPQALTMPHYKVDTSFIVNDLIRDLQQNKFSYDKNISKFISSKNDVDFFATYKVGLCRHFASYAALYLQKRGVPAHVVVGYFNPVNKDTPSGKYPLDGAHAWVEYFDGKTQTWNIFDGTSMVPLAEKRIQWSINKKIIVEEYAVSLVLTAVGIVILFMGFIILQLFNKYKIPSKVHPYFYLTQEEFYQWEVWYDKYPYWVTQWLVVWLKIKKRH